MSFALLFPVLLILNSIVSFGKKFRRGCPSMCLVASLGLAYTVTSALAKGKNESVFGRR